MNENDFKQTKLSRCLNNYVTCENRIWSIDGENIIQSGKIIYDLLNTKAVSAEICILTINNAFSHRIASQKSLISLLNVIKPTNTKKFTALLEELEPKVIDITYPTSFINLSEEAILVYLNLAAEANDTAKYFDILSNQICKPTSQTLISALKGGSLEIIKDLFSKKVTIPRGDIVKLLIEYHQNTILKFYFPFNEIQTQVYIGALCEFSNLEIIAFTFQNNTTNLNAESLSTLLFFTHLYKAFDLYDNLSEFYKNTINDVLNKVETVSIKSFEEFKFNLPQTITNIELYDEKSFGYVYGDYLSKFSRLKSLVLSNCELHYLKDLKSSIIEMDLSNNFITTVENCGPLSELTKLNLSFNFLTSIDFLSKAKSLRELDLSANQCLIDFSLLSKCPNLEKIKLSFNKTTNITSDQPFMNLIYLDLSRNEISSIPQPNLFPNLQKLDLSFNNITEIPNIMIEFKSLLDLNLSHNSISNFENLKPISSQLNTFKCESNNVSQFEVFTLLGYDSCIEKIAPSLSFFPNESKVHKYGSKMRGRLEVFATYQDNEGKTQFIAKKIHQMYMTTKEPTEIANILLNYYKANCTSLLQPTGVLLPNQDSRYYFTILSQVDDNYFTLDTVLNSVKPSDGKETHWNDTNRYIIAIGVAAALKSLHDMKMIHSRLTPSSILLDSMNYPFIWDHYLYSIEKDEIYSNFAQNTYQYVAPECLYSSDITEKADVYSFGIILRQLVFNDSIYDTTHKESAIYHAIQMGTTPKVECGTPFYKYLTNLCLEYDPNKRPSMKEIFEKLKDLKNELFVNVDKNQINEYIKTLESPGQKPPCNMEDVATYFSDLKMLREQADSNNPQKQLLYGKLLISKLETRLGLAYLRQAATSQDPIAMYKYGLVLSNAVAPDNDDATAFQYLKMASDKGNIEATAKYAQFLRKGRGCQKNLSQSLQLFKTAADKNCLSAQVGYAEMLHDGEGTSPNLREAFYYTKEAAKHGGADEIYNLAKCYHTGDGTSKDLRQALENYKIAADKGSLLAVGVISNVAKEGQKLSKKATDVFKKSHVSSDVQRAETLIMYAIMLVIGTDDVEKDTKAAAKLLKVAAQKGYAEAQYEYSILLKEGDGVSQSDKDSLQYLHNSAQNGFLRAQLAYGDHLLSNKEFLDAARVYKQAADNGNAEAQVNYGDLILQNKAGKIPVNDATKYFKMAAEQNHPLALYKLGVVCEGVAVEPVHFQKALGYYRQAMNLGVEKASLKVAKMLCELNENLEEAGDIIEKEMNKGNKECCYNLAHMYISGIGREIDYEKAIEILKIGLDSSQAIKCSFTLACLVYKTTQNPSPNSLKFFEMCQGEFEQTAKNIIGYAYYTGKGYGEDKMRAKQIWSISKEQGGSESMFNLAMMIMKGEIENDHENELENLLKKSAASGYFPAAFHYAEYLCKRMKDNDDDVARQYYSNAARGGHIPSMLKVAIMYDRGSKSFERSPSKALEFFKMAADTKIDEKVPQDWKFGRLDFIISESFFKTHEDYEHDLSLAMQRTGEILLGGEAGYSDYQLAREYFERARKHNDVEATFQLGQIYEHGLGVDCSTTRAKEYYEEAASKGHKFAKLYCNFPKTEREEIASLLDRYPNVNAEKAIEEILGNKEDGISTALKSLMKVSLDEEEDEDYDFMLDDLNLIADEFKNKNFPKLDNQTENLVQKKSSVFPQMSQFDFISYIQSESGSITDMKPPFMVSFETNMKLHMFPRRDGTQLGFKVAPTKLNTTYKNRKPVFKVDLKQNIDYSNPAILYNQSVSLQKEESTFDEGLKLLRLSAEQGFPSALFDLAKMYKYGDRIEKNEEIADKLFKLATERSNKE
ncbi:TKL family protein kinase [Trichomonas vaginalis G3]|uniref:TKL family protein kinase n=1 Tax=Trichomonas vaginalis (strain ATCC PRA-98 / G3) TaxID=412133 RepID=A2DDN3_TRIV3|nr:SEL-1-like protein family [Trichomonas vaginalis G3]EAY21409.1 TKL family protein kinase [Trichomonas vaginalis G3]KAI5490622.1 SEL-1-like protein family [Trichomonas vaginalis G3]|eukprot:XP_001582395.1 TKL family protein kinase [Trichomonas vaginalis G3]